MKILNIDTDCTDNGIGVRTTIYVAGCPHRCKNCHNPESWSALAGSEYSLEEILEKIVDNPIANVTISGGDPLSFQYKETLKLVRMIKERTNKTIWLYTGYTFDEIKDEKREILELVDCLVDGRFVQEKKDLTLQFRGSSNQRIVDVPNTLRLESVQLWRNGAYR